MKDTVYFIVISLIMVVMAYFVAFGCEKLIEKKDELGKSGNGYIEKLKARKAELEKSSSGYVNNINKYRKHIFNTLPTLNKSGKSIKILEYIKDIIECKEDKKENKSDS